jgi:hypothetical protein
MTTLKTRDPIAIVCAIAGLIIIFFFIYLFGFPLAADIITLQIGTFGPRIALAVALTPKTELPDAVLTTKAGLPGIPSGSLFFGKVIVVNPAIIFRPASLLPDKAFDLVFTPKSFNDLAVRSYATLLPNILVAGTIRIRGFSFKLRALVDLLREGSRPREHHKSHREKGKHSYRINSHRGWSSCALIASTRTQTKQPPCHTGFRLHSIPYTEGAGPLMCLRHREWRKKNTGHSTRDQSL